MTHGAEFHHHQDGVLARAEDAELVEREEREVDRKRRRAPLSLQG
jgi:hypothetical protein